MPRINLLCHDPVFCMTQRFQKIKFDSRFLFNVGFTNGNGTAVTVHAIKTLDGDEWSGFRSGLFNHSESIPPVPIE